MMGIERGHLVENSLQIFGEKYTSHILKNYCPNWIAKIMVSIVIL
jgi:hypothetical protein